FGQRKRDLRRGGRGRLRPGGRRRQRLGLLDRLQHALEDELQAEASCVDDPCVAQDLELARRLEDRGAGAGGGRGDDTRHVCIGTAGRRRRGATCLASDCEDRAFRGLVNRTVGGVRGLFECRGQLRRRERALTLDGTCEASEDL